MTEHKDSQFELMYLRCIESFRNWFAATDSNRLEMRDNYERYKKEFFNKYSHNGKQND